MGHAQMRKRGRVRGNRGLRLLLFFLGDARVLFYNPMAFFDLFRWAVHRFPLQFFRGLAAGLFFCATHYFFPPFVEIV